MSLHQRLSKSICPKYVAGISIFLHFEDPYSVSASGVLVVVVRVMTAPDSHRQ